MTSVVDRIKESDWKSLAGVIGALSSSTIAITDQLELHPVVKVVAIAAMFTLSILLFRNTIVRALMCVVGLFTLAFFGKSWPRTYILATVIRVYTLYMLQHTRTPKRCWTHHRELVGLLFRTGHLSFLRSSILRP
jgi:hypothetical protein